MYRMTIWPTAPVPAPAACGGSRPGRSRHISSPAPIGEIQAMPTKNKKKPAAARKPNPRATKAKALLELALDLEQDSMTCADIEQRCQVSEASARRMIRDLKDVFPSAIRKEGDDDGAFARFSMVLGAAARFSAFGADEYALLREAGRRLAAEGRATESRRIGAIAQKVLGMLERARRNRVEVDAAVLAQHEGIAVRPGPRPTIDPQKLKEIRHAILALRVIEIDYEPRIGARRPKTYRLEPHGLLFGNRHYLVAYPEGKNVPRPATFALGNIIALRQTKASFALRPGFDIDRFAGESFGVWHNDPIDVVWRFVAAAQRDVLETHFHDSQTKTILGDGQVEVRFRASGQEEMLHHMFTWRTALVGIDPPALRMRYREWLRSVLGGLDAMDAAVSSAAAPQAR
jgi:predicted DNA-binding transcriptional regulator YafY